MARWSPPRPLDDTRPLPHPDAVPGGAADPAAVVDVTLVLRPRAHPEDHPVARRTAAVDAAHPLARESLTLDDLAALHAPADEHVATVLTWARDHGLEVLEASAARHDVVVRGTAPVVEEAFGIRQLLHHHRGHTYRTHEGAVHLPREVADVVDAVLGLDEAPRSGPHHGGPPTGDQGPTLHSVSDLARHYDFPDVQGTLPRIAVLESGGYHPSDLTAFFQREGLPEPTLREVHVPDASGRPVPNAPLSADMLHAVAAAWKPGATFEDVAAAASAALDARGDLPSDPDAAKRAVFGVLAAFESTAEVTMDLQILGGMAPGAPIDVYFCSMSHDGWRRALFAMMGAPYPGQEAQPLPAVLSVSWGGSERTWGSARNLRAVHGALEAAARRGITVCCSSGDWGSRNERSPGGGGGAGERRRTGDGAGAHPGQAAGREGGATPSHNVNFPASSPAVLACGGTEVRPGGEVVWNEEVLGARMASGGGMSGVFGRPPYQKTLDTPDPDDTWIANGDAAFRGRWLPDVAANAAFSSGVRTYLGGAPFVGGGTSAATPLWAALLVRISAAAGRPLGCVNAALYRAGTGLAPVTEGTNDVSGTGSAVYRAGTSWDPCTGLGVPSGTALLDALTRHR